MPSKFRRWTNRLGTRLLLTYLCAWLLTSVLVAASVAGMVHFYGNLFTHHSVIEAATVLGKSVKFDEWGRPSFDALPDERAWIAPALPQDIAYRIFNDRGDVLLWSSPEARQAWTSAGVPADPGRADGKRVINAIDMEMRTMPLEGPNGHLWMQVGVSDRVIKLVHSEGVNSLIAAALATAVVSILLLGGAMLYTLRRLLEPIQKISQTAQEIELSQLDRRLDPLGVPGELLPLVESFNHALGRLELSYANQRRFLADTAHELKTPLALLRGQLELYGVSDTGQLIRDVDQITRQVQQLLMLAEISETRNYVQAPVDVEEVATDVLRYLGPLAERKAVVLDLQVTDAGIRQVGDRSALFVLLKNLVENAVSFAPAGTPVTVSLSRAAIRVRDRGQGIAPEHLAHLFERFWRGPGRQDEGAGLGLAICLEAARAHGWRLEAQNREPGAEFVLTF